MLRGLRALWDFFEIMKLWQVWAFIKHVASMALRGAPIPAKVPLKTSRLQPRGLPWGREPPTDLNLRHSNKTLGKRLARWQPPPKKNPQFVDKTHNTRFARSFISCPVCREFNFLWVSPKSKVQSSNQLAMKMLSNPPAPTTCAPGNGFGLRAKGR